MFYCNDKIIEYPNKSVLEDVLSREGEPDSESFTPFNGCRHLIRKQLHRNVNDIEIGDILKNSIDFKVHMAKANDDINRNYGTSEVLDYYSNLEEIDQFFIDKYVTEVLIGYKRNHNGLKEKGKELDTVPQWYDEESERYITVSDIKQKERGFQTEEILEAKNKLPYLLKQLHSGSILYKGSLLSFIIAAAKCFKKNENNPGYYLVPRDLVPKGVYRMNSNGDITSRFYLEENTGEILRNLISWICGKCENDIYYNAYQELIKVLSILELDICNEDARNYTSDYMRKIVCTYLASNEEYLETYGFADRKILTLLSPDKLFTIAAKVSEEDVTPERLEVNMVADSIATNTEVLKYKFPDRWKDQVKSVNRFLKYYCDMLMVPAKQVSDYDVCKGLLRKLDGTYVTLNVSSIADPCLNRNLLAVISIAGYLIMVENFDACLRYLDLDTAIHYFGGCKDYKKWEYLYL